MSDIFQEIPDCPSNECTSQTDKQQGGIGVTLAECPTSTSENHQTRLASTEQEIQTKQLLVKTNGATPTEKEVFINIDN